ncbi:hypothetical protein [Roseobacter sp. HKCCA0434]
MRLDHEVREELVDERPEFRGHLDIYVILTAEVIVTVCHDTGRLRRRLH